MTATVTTPSDLIPLQQQIDDLRNRVAVLEMKPAPESKPEPPPAPPPDPVPAGDFAAIKAIIAGLNGKGAAVSKNTAKDVAPTHDKTVWAVQGPASIFACWGGAAFMRDSLYHWGGGHNDYGGNEMLRFDTASFLWTRETDPSPLTALGNGSFAVEGSIAPVSGHSYGSLVYAPNVDAIWNLPQAQYQSGNGYDVNAYLYAAGSWTRLSRHSDRIGPDACADYWPKTGEVVISTPNGIAAHNPATDKWRQLYNWDNQDFGRTAAIDPTRDLFVQVWKQTAPLCFYDLNAPKGRRAAPVTGDTTFTQYPAASIKWHAPTSSFVIWAGGNEVWTVDRDWVSKKHVISGLPAYRTGNTGCYNKLQWSERLDAFFFCRAWDEPVYVFAYPTGSGSGEDTTPEELPSTVMAKATSNSTITLPKGEFVDSFVIPSTLENVTIDGTGCVLKRSQREGKAAVVNYGRSIKIVGLTVLDVTGSGNSCAFYHAGVNLHLQRVRVERCEMNLRTSTNNYGSLLIDDCDFLDSVGADQLGHNIYASRSKTGGLIVLNSRIIGAGRGGHVIKSRAATTHIEGSKLAQLGSVSSAPIDCPEGGTVYIDGNLIEQGTYSDISPVIINYGREVGQFADLQNEVPGELVIEDNTIISDYVSPDGRIGPRGAQLAVLVLGTHANCDNVARVRRNRIVWQGSPMKMGMTWADRQPERIVEDVENVFIVGREAAGLKPYPSLE
jgi:hypothetical protein